MWLASAYRLWIVSVDCLQIHTCSLVRYPRLGADWGQTFQLHNVQVWIVDVGWLQSSTSWSQHVEISCQPLLTMGWCWNTVFQHPDFASYWECHVYYYAFCYIFRFYIFHYYIFCYYMYTFYDYYFVILYFIILYYVIYFVILYIIRWEMRECTHVWPLTRLVIVPSI